MSGQIWQTGIGERFSLFFKWPLGSGWTMAHSNGRGSKPTKASPVAKPQLSEGRGGVDYSMVFATSIYLLAQPSRSLA